MGITADQVAKGAVQRLRYHYEALVELPEKSIEWDMHAWAFARTAVTSEDIAGIIRDVAQAFEDGVVDLEAEYERLKQAWPYENIVDPRLGLEVIELVLRAHTLLDVQAWGEDQCSGINAGVDAWCMLDEWEPEGGREAILYLDDDLYAELRGLFGFDPDSWVGVREALDRDVPEDEVKATLARLAKGE